MKIMMLSDRIPPDHLGGAEKVAWALAGALHQVGHTVHVVAATPGASFREVREGIAIYHLHSSYPERWRGWLSLYNPQVIPAFQQLLAEIKPDVIHAHNIHADLSYATLRAANQAGIPVVFTAHDMMPVVYGKMRHITHAQSCEVSPSDYRLPALYNMKENRLRYNPLRNHVIRSFLKQHTQVRTALSQAHRAALEANGLPPFEVVPNGLDPQAFEAVREETIAALCQEYLLEGKRVVLFAGRMNEDKGSRQLLLALDQAIQHVPELRLLVLSARPVESHWLHGLSHLTRAHICEAGWLSGERLAAAYHLADMVVYPSIYLDPFGMVNLEAMAAGKPVIASCYGGARDIVADGQTGYIINPFNITQFAARLVEVLQDDALRLAMGKAGQQRLMQFFTLAHQRDVMLELYQRVLKTSPEHKEQRA